MAEGMAQNSVVSHYPHSRNKRRYTDSSTFKLALLLTVLIGIAAGVLGHFINQFNTGVLIERAEIAINADYASFNDWREMVPLLSIPEVLDRVKKTRETSLNTYQGVFSYTAANGDHVYGGMIPADAEISQFYEDIVLLHLMQVDIKPSLGFEGAHRFAAKTYTLEDGSKLLIGRDIEQPLIERTRMQQLGILTVVLMLIVIVGSFYFSTYIVGLTNNIGETAKEIMETEDFSRRIAASGRGDDLGSLVSVLNELLEKTELLMLSVRQVSDNVAHDLRTPLTRLRNRLDELESHVKSSGDTAAEEMSESLIKEADHILGTFGALLRIARIESGKREKAFERVELVPLLEDILELYSPLAEESGIEIAFESKKLSTWGDPDMLFQVFANLMDNAVKFTPAGGKIKLSCLSAGEQVCIALSDSGSGISDEDKLQIFDRFYRGEKSRHTRGNGLGLSLVQAVMKLHKAYIEVFDNEPGTKFVIHLLRYQKNWRRSRQSTTKS